MKKKIQMIHNKWLDLVAKELNGKKWKFMNINLTYRNIFDTWLQLYWEQRNVTVAAQVEILVIKFEKCLFSRFMKQFYLANVFKIGDIVRMCCSSKIYKYIHWKLSKEFYIPVSEKWYYIIVTDNYNEIMAIVWWGRVNLKQKKHCPF